MPVSISEMRGKSDQDRHFGKAKQRDEQKNSVGKNR